MKLLMNGKLLIIIYQDKRIFLWSNLWFILLSVSVLYGYENGISSVIIRIRFLVSKEFFFMRWWDKGMNPTLPETVQKIKAHTQACWDAIPKTIPSQTVIQNRFLQIQIEIRQKYMNLLETKLVIKSMDFMKEQFLQTIASDDTSIKSVTCSQN